MLFSTIVAAICGIATGLFTGDPAVDLWLTSDEVERLFGEAAEPLYIIQNGVRNPSISPLLLDDNHDDGSVDPKGKKLLLPADLNFMKIAWRAPKPFHYTFMELRSSDPAIMGPPLLSITLEDSMPSNDTEFRIDFPCTGEHTGIASVSVILRIRHYKSGLDIPSSPIHLTFDKECIEAPTCEPRCANRGICNRHGRCDCPAGFFGQTCRIIFCIPHCYNSGTCVSPGVCSCLKGFIGSRCQKALCPNDCSGHGYCYKPGYCYCYHGWTGANCDEREDFPQYPFRLSSNRSTNLRLVKNRRLWSDTT